MRSTSILLTTIVVSLAFTTVKAQVYDTGSITFIDLLATGNGSVTCQDANLLTVTGVAVAYWSVQLGSADNCQDNTCDDCGPGIFPNGMTLTDYLSSGNSTGNVTFVSTDNEPTDMTNSAITLCTGNGCAMRFNGVGQNDDGIVFGYPNWCVTCMNPTMTGTLNEDSSDIAWVVSVSSEDCSNVTIDSDGSVMTYPVQPSENLAEYLMKGSNIFVLAENNGENVVSLTDLTTGVQRTFVNVNLTIDTSNIILIQNAVANSTDVAEVMSLLGG